MAILVITGGDDLDRVVVERLVEQGDEVRVLEGSSARRGVWAALGAFVAIGEGDDPDLVERAAQNVRTIVVMSGRVTTSVVANVVEVGPKAGVDRIVCCAGAVPDDIKSLVRSGPLDHVLIETGRRGLLGRKRPPRELIAEAVDAADDLAGTPRLEVDLADPEQRRALGL